MTFRLSGSIPGLGRSLGGGNGNPLQYSCLENPIDRGAWRAMIHRVPKGQTSLKILSMQACTYIYSLFLRSFSHIGYHRMLSRVPCAIQ